MSTFVPKKFTFHQILTFTKKITIITDGWSNIRRDHIVNFVLSIPKSKPIYYGFIDCKGTSQTGKQIAFDIIQVIEDIGHNKIVAVVTDNASNMRSSWQIIRNKYPHIFTLGCASHVLNLLVQDLCKLDDNEDTLKQCSGIVTFIKDRTFLRLQF